MSRVLFIGDLHFGHTKAVKFRDEFKTIEEHDEFICTLWESSVKKNDVVYVCGDVAFTTEGLERIAKLPGRKFLVRGNHDVFAANRYLVFFEDIGGLVKLKYGGQRYWVSHAPIHPNELRDGINVHGHVHKATIMRDYKPDPRYLNVSAENIGYEPRTLDWLSTNLHPRTET